MNWKLKASLQKVLHFTKIGDKLNHIPATLKKDYHKNVMIYQTHECLRKFDETNITFNVEKEMIALEIGTGYSLVSPVVLYLLGFDKIVTVDISKDVSIKTFHKQIQYLEKEGFLVKIAERGIFSLTEIKEKLQHIQSCKTLENLCTFCNIVYI